MKNCKVHFDIKIDFFNANIFRGFKKKFTLWEYEFGNGKKCEFQHHLNFFF
jgi:hypothetical protein